MPWILVDMTNKLGKQLVSQQATTHLSQALPYRSLNFTS